MFNCSTINAGKIVAFDSHTQEVLKEFGVISDEDCLIDNKLKFKNKEI